MPCSSELLQHGLGLKDWFVQQKALIVLFENIVFMSCCLDTWVKTVNRGFSSWKLFLQALAAWVVVTAVSSRKPPLQARWL